MVAQVRMPGETRGEANNNPGNIDRTNPRTAWQGRVADAKLTDPRFEQFVAPQWGIRAIAGTLQAYYDKHGLDTVKGLIDRWAPPTENITSAYVSDVCIDAKLAPDQKLNLADYSTMLGIVVGIIHHENGRQPYSDAILEEGLKLAGVVKDPVASLGATKPVTVAAVVSTAAAGLAAVAVQHAPHLTGGAISAGHAVMAGAGVVVAAAGGALAWHASRTTSKPAAAPAKATAA